ncbi:MAG: DMT family transporter [Xanthobacteraceae bacterium]
MRNPEPVRHPAGLGDGRARLMLALLCVIWGTTWPIMKIALDGIPPFTMRTLSTALAAPTLYLICVVSGRSLRLPNAKAFAHVVVASLLNIVFFTLLIAFGQLVAATSRVAILAYTVPIWSLVLAWPFLGERPSPMQLVALGLCGVGLAVLIYPLAASGIPLGLLLALAAGLSWAAGTVYLKWARIDADPVGVASWQLIIAFVAFVVSVFLVDGGLQLGAATARSLLATAFVGVAGGGIAYGLWFAIVPRLPAVTSSLAVLGSPVIGVLSSMAILGEMPTASDIIGFALIFAASACALLGKQPAAKPMS